LWLSENNFDLNKKQKNERMKKKIRPETGFGWGMDGIEGIKRETNVGDDNGPLVRLRFNPRT
jgi:hypothetical protein